MLLLFFLSDCFSVWCATGSEMNVMDHFHKVLHSIKGTFQKTILNQSSTYSKHLPFCIFLYLFFSLGL